jgi:hypothetical protein
MQLCKLLRLQPSVTKQVTSRTSELDEYLCKPVDNVKDPLKWWVAHHHIYPNLSHMALDYLSIPGKYLFLLVSCPITNCIADSYNNCCQMRVLAGPPTPVVHI